MAFTIFGHLRTGVIAVLFDPNCFNLDVISTDVLICICHAADVVSQTPETSFAVISHLHRPYLSLYCLVLRRIICQVLMPIF